MEMKYLNPGLRSPSKHSFQNWATPFSSLQLQTDGLPLSGEVTALRDDIWSGADDVGLWWGMSSMQNTMLLRLQWVEHLQIR